ncbi:GH1 family beta-glucosidase [Sulfitobacter sp. S190]|uniref:GH1 family beta-glucosidase n=1 Tax=Sulfitobacter sp. S190 TaxID=2867022 RepID=UPI0021A8D03F|nr:GH1 family beta-glucosidase [Sulfitobacter sp. S190]UWR23922.1 beta-glucosidase [Sulfitobacter sp. S190]
MKIPQDFVLGVATAAYQIEGTRFGDVGPSHWDSFAAQGGTIGRQNGDVACAHYEKWLEDLDLIAHGNFDAYRFSVAWPRIQRDGREAPRAEGLDFYDQLVDGALARGIEPHCTLYHWDLPQALADKGGWENQDTAKYFADYCAHVSDRLGDRLASVATVNEPWCVAWLSHFLGHHAPGKRDLSAAAKAMHNILYAHGLGAAALRDLGRKDIGIVLNMEYAAPATDREADRHAAAIFDGIYNRWFIEALTKGAYPSDILEHLEPHMPVGWQDQMQTIAQPLDWMGLNYYTRSIHADDGTGIFPFGQTQIGPLPKTSMGWEVYPEGLQYFLERMHRDYTGNLPLYVTENGMALHDKVADGGVDDAQRVGYFRDHLAAALAARDAGVPLKGYFAWSLLDNFEWAFGYSERFGLVHVDYDTQTRTPKESFRFFQNLR